MGKYFKPELIVFRASDLAEAIGPVQTAYDATMNVYGGRTAQSDTKHSAEYRIAKADANYGIFTQGEVEHA